MNHRKTISSLGFILILALGAAWLVRAQDSSTACSSITSIEQYLMRDPSAEIALARSAAPEPISRDTEILVLEGHAYETAVKGKNGPVCLVERSWAAPFDDPEFLNPDQRLAIGLNPPSAQTHLPLTFTAIELVFAGMSKTQMFDSIKAAFNKKELPLPAPGSMCYTMSEQRFFSHLVANAHPHLMFWFHQQGHVAWGADSPDYPVGVHQYSRSRSPNSVFR